MSEKRKHKRVPFSAVTKLTMDTGMAQGMVADISMGGIGLYMDRPLQDGVEVSLEIHFNVSGGQIVTETMTGTVVYSHRIQNVSFVGIEFTGELGSESQPVLYNRVQNIIKSY